MQNKKILLTALLSASAVTISATASETNTPAVDVNKNIDVATKVDAKQSAISGTAAQLAAPHDYYNSKGHIRN